MEDYTTKSSLSSPSAQHNTHPEVEVVAKAEVTKRSLGQRIKNYIFAGNMQDLRGYLISDILVPTVKDLISESVSKGIDMLLFNDSSPRRSSSNRIREASRSSLGNAYINYNNSSSNRDRRNKPARDRYVEENVAELEDGYLTWATRPKAEEVRNKMIDILDEYDVVTVGTFYELAGFKTEPNDFNYGWYNLSTAEVVRTRDGRYRLELPKAVSIN